MNDLARPRRLEHVFEFWLQEVSGQGGGGYGRVRGCLTVFCEFSGSPRGGRE